MDFLQMRYAANCWRCERLELLWTDGNTQLCLSCLEAESTRYELEVLEDASISPRSLELSLSDLARSLNLAGRMAAMKVHIWTREGGGLYLFGPDELRTTLARAAASALWQTARDQPGSSAKRTISPNSCAAVKVSSETRPGLSHLWRSP